MSTLIKVGCLLMTPEQFKRALDEDMTISQAYQMIRQESESAPSELPLPDSIISNPELS